MHNTAMSFALLDFSTSSSARQLVIWRYRDLFKAEILIKRLPRALLFHFSRHAVRMNFLPANIIPRDYEMAMTLCAKLAPVLLQRARQISRHAQRVASIRKKACFASYLH